jgi:hypothetical protein
MIYVGTTDAQAVEAVQAALMDVFSATPGVLIPGDTNPADSPLWAVTAPHCETMPVRWKGPSIILCGTNTTAWRDGGRTLLSGSADGWVPVEGVLEQRNVMRARAPSVKITTHNRHRSAPSFKSFVVLIATRSAQSERPTPSLNQSQAAFYSGRRKSERRFVFAALTCRYASPRPKSPNLSTLENSLPVRGHMEVYS